MSRHPHLGVPKSKPRLAGAEPNGGPASKEEIARLSAEYLRTRNEQMRAKALSAQMKLAKERGELISKELDLVGEGHGLLRHSPAQLRGLVCTHVFGTSRLDLDRPTA